MTKKKATKTKKAKAPLITVPSLAEIEFINFMEKGIYSKRKELKTFLEQAKDHLYLDFKESEHRRHEFKDLNMVVKFVRKKIWDTNHQGIIEEMFNWVRPETMLPLLSIDKKMIEEKGILSELEPFALPTTYFVRPYLNKIGKEKVGTYDFLFGGQSTEQLIEEIREVNQELTKIDAQYEAFKQTIGTCPVLRKNNKVQTPYGSISRSANETKWDLEKVLEAKGEDFLISNGKVNVNELDNYIRAGIIPKQVVSEHRALIDIRLDFVVMQLDAEQRALNAMEYKRKQNILRTA